MAREWLESPGVGPHNSNRHDTSVMESVMTVALRWWPFGSSPYWEGKPVVSGVGFGVDCYRGDVLVKVAACIVMQQTG